MKTSFIAAVSLVLIAGIPLSAGAKPAEALQREGMQANGHQGGGEIVLAAAGKARGDDDRSNSDGRQTGNGGGNQAGNNSSPAGSGNKPGSGGPAGSGGGNQHGGTFEWLAQHDNHGNNDHGGGHDDGHGGGHGDHDDDHDASPCKPRH